MTNPDDTVSRRAVLVALTKHAKGSIVIGGQTFRTIQLGEAATAVMALPAVAASQPADPVTNADSRQRVVTGWVIANGQGNRWRCVWKWETNAEWTDDISKALKFATRDDAEAFSADDEDAWLIQEVPIAAIDVQTAPRDAQIDEATAFDRADWYWRTMDPDDSGETPNEAVNRGMLGLFCVCEIASSYHGPTRYGFIAPTLDPESDDEEFVHFATHDEAMEAAKARAALAAAKGGDA